MKKCILFFVLILTAFVSLDAQIRYDAEPPAAGIQIHDAAKVLYITCGNKLAVFNIAVPEKPVLTAEISLSHFPQSLALDTENNVLYAADSVSVKVIDISKPDQPELTDRDIRIDGSPVDLLLRNGVLWIAARRGGLWEVKDNKPVRKSLPWNSKNPEWIRAVTALQNGGTAVCGLDAVLLTVKTAPDAGPENILIENMSAGTPRRIREGITPGTYYVANGFCGYGKVILALPDSKDRKKGIAVQKQIWTENLNRFSSYGSYVFDVMELSGNVLLLAAGEIGIVTVINGKLNNDCGELNWGNINGFIRGKGNLVYAVDQLSGLCVLDVTDPEKIKVLERIKLVK